jgi:putative PIN family toxin of toxin-antitoxin system
MKRLVLDTNVVFASFAARGVCEAVFELCLKRWHLVASGFLTGELAEKLASKLKLPPGEVEAIVDFYRSKCELVLPATVPAGACRDPDDLPVLGTCLSGRAECLVTGDKDLLDLARFEDVEILSPREFFDRYNQEDDEAR